MRYFLTFFILLKSSIIFASGSVIVTQFEGSASGKDIISIEKSLNSLENVDNSFVNIQDNTIIINVKDGVNVSDSKIKQLLSNNNAKAISIIRE